MLIADAGGRGIFKPVLLNGTPYFVQISMLNRAAAGHGHGRGLAAAHARHGLDADIGKIFRLEPANKLLRAEHLAGDGITDAHGAGRGRGLVFLQDIKMVIKRGGLVDLRHRHAHFERQGLYVATGNGVIAILDFVQMLDQELALARRIAEQGPDLRHGLMRYGAALKAPLLSSGAFHAAFILTPIVNSYKSCPCRGP